MKESYDTTIQTRGKQQGAQVRDRNLPDLPVGVRSSKLPRAPHTDKMTSRGTGWVGEKRGFRPDWYLSLTVLNPKVATED